MLSFTVTLAVPILLAVIFTLLPERVALTTLVLDTETDRRPLALVTTTVADCRGAKVTDCGVTVNTGLGAGVEDEPCSSDSDEELSLGGVVTVTATLTLDLLSRTLSVALPAFLAVIFSLPSEMLATATLLLEVETETEP
ncbi:MAG: hypothetical protein PHX10_02230 [Gallionellaceae bacterium]|nr:hypothetical protein [Gallionellaceae bacterium]